jgi:hypothetical protein
VCAVLNAFWLVKHCGWVGGENNAIMMVLNVYMLLAGPSVTSLLHHRCGDQVLLWLKEYKVAAVMGVDISSAQVSPRFGRNIASLLFPAFFVCVIDRLPAARARSEPCSSPPIAFWLFWCASHNNVCIAPGGGGQRAPGRGRVWRARCSAAGQRDTAAVG